MEAVIRDERNKLVEFLNDAPIGFYSVDSAGRFLFVNQTLAGWLGCTAAELVGSNARMHDFLAEPPAGEAAPWDPFGGTGHGGSAAKIALKSRDGRIIHAWIGQSAVGEGAELRTRSVVRDLNPRARMGDGAGACRASASSAFSPMRRSDRADRTGSGACRRPNRALGELFGARPENLNRRTADRVCRGARSPRDRGEAGQPQRTAFGTRPRSRCA